MGNNKVNLELLRFQKQQLLKLYDKDSATEDEKNAIGGVINLLEALEGHAPKEGTACAFAVIEISE